MWNQVAMRCYGMDDRGQWRSRTVERVETSVPLFERVSSCFFHFNMIGIQ